MTIKQIKSDWSGKDMIQGLYGKKQFAVADYGPFGKCVAVVVNDGEWRTVVALVQVSTGNDLFRDEHSRPCYNMHDALDVADEILQDMYGRNYDKEVK